MEGVLQLPITPPVVKKVRMTDTKPSTASPSPSTQPPLALQQWLDDVSNVDISLSVTVGKEAKEGILAISQPGFDDSCATSSLLTDEMTRTISIDSEGHSGSIEVSEFNVSIPNMLTRVLQQKLRIDPSRMNTNVSPESPDLYLTVTVKPREQPIQDAIAGGLTPRKAFLKSSPHISRVASQLQECLRQMFGMRDFVVQVE